MTETDTTINTGVEVSDKIIDVIVDALIKDMTEKIANISPDDDSSADYGECWTRGSYDSDDYLELDKPYSDYEISYKYELSWRYRVWTEYWTDPVCYPTFDEMDSEAGEVYDIEIITPAGEDVKQSICNKIAKTVNEKIK